MSTALSTQTIEELWHLADIDATSENVRFRGQSGHLRGTRPSIRCMATSLFTLHDFVMTS